ncbi:MAG TPA: integrase [Candidatus Nitrosocosmicus sp.]|nr:integrase [Candidatus Nitrosocosmicus sp.]
MNEFVHAWIKGEYPKHENNEQVKNLIERIRDRGIKDPLTGEFNPTFYRNVKSGELLTDLSKRYAYPKHAKDLVRYFERYVEIFFTKPDLIRAESGHKRAWICDAMRRFGEYYDRKFHNPELKLLIQEIIERYELNRKMKIHDRIWISDDNYIKKQIKKILQIDGDIGILIKFALFSGLRGEEITYVHDTPICNNLSGCNCPNLHIIDKENGYSVIVLNRSVGQKHSYFSIVSTIIWKEFRNLDKANYEQRKIAHSFVKNYTDNESSFMDLRKFHYNILCRSGLKERGAEILAGRANSVSAKHYLIYELDKMVEEYSISW